MLPAITSQILIKNTRLEEYKETLSFIEIFGTVNHNRVINDKNYKENVINIRNKGPYDITDYYVKDKNIFKSLFKEYCLKDNINKRLMISCDIIIGFVLSYYFSAIGPIITSIGIYMAWNWTIGKKYGKIIDEIDKLNWDYDEEKHKEVLEYQDLFLKN